MAFIELRGLSRRYGDFAALQPIDLDIEAGEFLAIHGASGSGKSTLLNLLGGIDRASSGTLRVGELGLQDLSERQLAAWRGRELGFVFQFFHLLPQLSALENVLLPMDFAGRWSDAEKRERAMALLARLGVAAQAGQGPATLSGGQQQRVALARALANEPRLLLADEPTGNLDSSSGAQLLELLAELVDERGLTVVMVTHDAASLAAARRRVGLRDGRLL